MTDLNSLAIFAQVVEANSFSEAARRMKMPTSTVSRRVAELESQLGVRLIERSTRSLRLTDIGSEVLEHAQRKRLIIGQRHKLVGQLIGGAGNLPGDFSHLGAIGIELAHQLRHLSEPSIKLRRVRCIELVHDVMKHGVARLVPRRVARTTAGIASYLVNTLPKTQVRHFFAV